MVITFLLLQDAFVSAFLIVYEIAYIQFVVFCSHGLNMGDRHRSFPWRLSEVRSDGFIIL